MTQNKQINEMAEAICCVKQNCNDVCNPVDSCSALVYARRACEAGYRKSSEVAEEIFGEIEKETEIGRIMNACAIVSLDAIAELKKKYTESEDTE